MSRLELKRRAAAFYAQHQVSKILEDLLNVMFLDEPDDVCGYMSEYFKVCAKKPVVEKIVWKRVFSASGYQTVKGSLFCVVSGVSKLVGDLQCFIDSHPVRESVKLRRVNSRALNSKNDAKGKPAKKEVACDVVMVKMPLEKSGSAWISLERLAAHLNESFGSCISGMNVEDQTDVDCRLRALSEELIKRFTDDSSLPLSQEVDASTLSMGSQPPGCPVDATARSDAAEAVPEESAIATKRAEYKLEVETAALLVSVLAAISASCIRRQDLCEYLLTTRCELKKDKIVVPVPMVCMLSSGIENPGKCNLIKELFLLPKPTSNFSAVLVQMSSLFKEIEKALASKFPGSALPRNEQGALMPSVEKAEQIFEILTAACEALQLQLTRDFDIFLNVGASDFYDEEKCKYDVCSGTLKTAEELIDMYRSWLEIYPIIGIIDGLAEKDLSKWSVMTSQLSRRCLTVADRLTSSNSIYQVAEHCSQQLYNAVVCRPEKCCSTVTDFIQFGAGVKDPVKATVMFDYSPNSCHSSIFVDLAVACSATFLAFGAPCGAERIASLNRYVDIYTTLSESEQFAVPSYDWRFQEPLDSSAGSEVVLPDR